MKKQILSACMGSLLFMGNGAMSVAAGLSSIAVTPANSTIAPGQTRQYTATGMLRDGSTQDISASGVFSATGSMDTSRESLSATTLTNGKVLISGGSSNGLTTPSGRPGCDVCNTAELYDPATETYSYTDNDMATARYMHTSTLLADGTVLVAGGGTNKSVIINTAEIYDPATNRFSSNSGVGGTMTMARNFHRATLLQNGMVLIVGGQTPGLAATATAEIYSPVTKTFTATSSMSTPRGAPTATLLPDGTVLVAGGWIDGSYASTDTAEIFQYDPNNPKGGTFTPTDGPMITPVAHATATLLQNGMVLIVGGTNAAGSTSTAQLYNPASRTFSSTGSLTTARFAHTATLLQNGKVLVTGGQGGQPFRINDPELYDPTAGTFSATALMSTARNWHRAALLNNGQVFVVGGFVAGPDGGVSDTATAELYTPQADWSSSNVGVATINAKTGLATGGTAIGTTTITATSGTISGSAALDNGPDLIVTAVGSSGATSVNRGKTFTFTATTKNLGSRATTVATSTGLYLFNGTSSTYLGNLSITSGLAAGATSTVISKKVTVPSNQPLGTYTLRATADYTNAQVETKELNNTLTGPATIQVK